MLSGPLLCVVEALKAACCTTVRSFEAHCHGGGSCENPRLCKYVVASSLLPETLCVAVSVVGVSSQVSGAWRLTAVVVASSLLLEEPTSKRQKEDY